jgi:hypothetical protein
MALCSFAGQGKRDAVFPWKPFFEGAFPSWIAAPPMLDEHALLHAPCHRHLAGAKSDWMAKRPARNFTGR